MTPIKEWPIRENPASHAALDEAIEAVCDELDVRDNAVRRAAIEAGVRAAFARGPRLPLNLVHAGLGAA